MAFSLSQWVNRSIALALAGADLSASPVLDPDDIAEAYAHQVMREVAEEFAADVSLRPYVVETVTIALTNGVGAIPSRVLENFLPQAIVSDPALATVVGKMVFLPWEDFTRAAADSDRGYFAVKGTSFYLVRPGSAYAAGSGMTGNIDVSVAAAVDMPATESATITCPLRFELALVQRLAEKIMEKKKAA